ncbi:MAG: NAD(P)-dependent dehydrogenase (short-subunit alcohol dehydrogenase family) [Candidatus Azotimanducaceae bacterium]|jgi:NAD(P)-dependent dehydrogenase (short-subunit alcohol dehydrogenase family)
MIKSSFNKKSTAEQVTADIDLNGKTVVITGINSGLGNETMRVLAKRGAHVIGTARTIEKATQAANEIKGHITPIACELSNFASVKKCADNINALNLPIDVLLCNAGIMALPKLELANGFEQQFNTNHLGHFLLVHNLLYQVKQAEQGRIVMLSSLAHRMAPSTGINFDNLDGNKYYKDWTFYGQSKLANLLTAVALSKRLEGSKATANAVHPGIIRTNLSRSMGGVQGLVFNNPVSGWVAGMMMGSKTVPQGAATQCYVATASELAGVSGRYFSDSNEERPSRHGQDQKLADRLWEFSCETLKDYL